MRYVVIAVRDRAADVFGQPSFVQSIGVGMRSFSDAVNSRDEKSPLTMHPEDFDLYHLADYDDNTGKFSAVDPPRMISVGKDVRVKE